MSAEPLYLEIVHITDHYFGPVADRFVQRQIRNHLQIEPAELKQADLPRLISWIRATLSVVTDDDQLINDYLEKLKGLANRG